MVKVVGIDPGLAATGIGVVKGRGGRIDGYSFGCITTSNETPLPERLDRIFSRLSRLFDDEKPDLVVLENVFSLKEYPKSGISLGQVTGIVLLAVARARATWLGVSVREAKQVLTGNGKATKAQLESAVRHQLGHPSVIRPLHASDALGLAIIGLLRYDARLLPPPTRRCGVLRSAAGRHRRQ